MEKEQLYQTIEAYLDGELRPEERARFEQELATDSALATEVALHQRLQEQFGDPARMDLRYMLEEIAREFPDPPNDIEPESNLPDNTPPPSSGGIPFWWWGLGFFLIIGGGVLWYLQATKPDFVDVVPTEIVENENPIPEPIEEEVVAVPEEEITEPPAQNSPPPAGPSAFATNDELESLVGTEASKRYTFTDSELTYALQGNRAYLNFSGKLTTARPTEEGFFLTVYTSRYPEGRVARYPLAIQEVKDPAQAFAARQYFLAYSGETSLQQGLYYGVISIGNSGIPLWVGKIRVTEKE